MKSPLRKPDENWTELSPVKTYGTGMSPVTIPETIVGGILAPVPFSFVCRVENQGREGQCNTRSTAEKAELLFSV